MQYLRISKNGKELITIQANIFEDLKKALRILENNGLQPGYIELKDLEYLVFGEPEVIEFKVCSSGFIVELINEASKKAQFIERARKLYAEIEDYIYNTRNRAVRINRPFPSFSFERGQIQGIRDMLSAYGLDQLEIDQICPLIS